MLRQSSSTRPLITELQCLYCTGSLDLSVSSPAAVISRQSKDSTNEKLLFMLRLRQALTCIPEAITVCNAYC